MATLASSSFILITKQMIGVFNQIWINLHCVELNILSGSQTNKGLSSGSLFAHCWI